MRRAAAAGADTASRAAIVGGAVATSNSAVGYELGLTPAGTHAHSMVQLFIALGEGEDAAFEAYADVYPDDTLLLVDTVDTMGSGVPNAIATFERLRRRGHVPVGIRLDSGDLAFLAVEAARELDRAGFPDTVIVLSSQLDELTIWQITAQIAAEARRHGMDPDAVIGRLVFGVGSRLATSHGDPSLDGVYKLVAVDDGAGTWKPSMKRSDSPVKVLNPGAKRLWRAYDERGVATADVLSAAAETLVPGSVHLHHHARPDVSRTVTVGAVDELLVPVVAGGAIVADGARRRRRGSRPPGRRRRALRPRRASPRQPARVPRVDHRRRLRPQAPPPGRFLSRLLPAQRARFPEKLEDPSVVAAEGEQRPDGLVRSVHGYEQVIVGEAGQHVRRSRIPIARRARSRGQRSGRRRRARCAR